MSEYVTDTHALVWHLTKSKKLSDTAREIFQKADEGWYRIHVPAIVVVELVYLAEKNRVEKSLLTDIITLLKTEGGSYTLSVLDLEIAKTMIDIPREQIPEMPDRLVAATARKLKLPLISRDQAIQAEKSLEVIW